MRTWRTSVARVSSPGGAHLAEAFPSSGGSLRWAGRMIAVALGLLVIGAFTGLRVPGPAYAGGTVYYVSTAGSDSNAGTLDKPWRTIGKSLSSLDPGDTLEVRGGTYVERVMNPSIIAGTAAAPVTIEAYNGERPVVQGLLWLTGASYWTLDGINVTWDATADQADEHLVKLTNGVGWVFENAEVWGAHSYAAMLVASTVTGEPADWTVQGNCLHDTYPTHDPNQDQLLYVNSGLSSSGGTVQYNLLFNATNGEGVKLGGSSAEVGGAANVTVQYNTIYDTAQNILVAWGSHDNTLQGNILDKTGDNYGNIRGYQLSGAANVATDNAGGESKELVLNDAGYPGVTIGDANQFPVDVTFDQTTDCDGFHPSTSSVQSLGRYGGAEASEPTPVAGQYRKTVDVADGADDQQPHDAPPPSDGLARVDGDRIGRSSGQGSAPLVLGWPRLWR
jgi:hypothetical protein